MASHKDEVTRASQPRMTGSCRWQTLRKVTTAVLARLAVSPESLGHTILELLDNRNVATAVFAELRGQENILGNHTEEDYVRIRMNEKITIEEDEQQGEEIPRIRWLDIPFTELSAGDDVSRAGKQLSRHLTYLYDMELTKVLGMGSAGTVALFTATDKDGESRQVVGKIYPEDGTRWKSLEMSFLEV